MRLIDADEMKKSKAYLALIIGMPFDENVIRKNIDDFIDQQKTAYDVEEKVRQMELLWNEAKANYNYTRNTYFDGKMDGLDLAIQMVRGE